jgi:hypothetical protein
MVTEMGLPPRAGGARKVGGLRGPGRRATLGVIATLALVGSGGVVLAQPAYATVQSTQAVWFTTTNPSPVNVGGTYTPAAAASSGLAVAITLDGASSGCSLSGGVVSFDGAGTCLIDADQAGDAGYSPATQVQQSITVASQTLSLYVAPTGSDSNTCTSALVPCLTVRRAVTLGETNLGAATAVTVNIAAGTYTENVNVGAVPSGDSLSLIGAGAASTTINAGGQPLPVIVIPSTTSGAVNIAGLTLTGSNSNDPSGNGNGTGPFGGGIGDAGAGPVTVTDTTLTNNWSLGGGGGIYALNSSPSASVTVTGSTISDNTAEEGGGIYNVDGPPVTVTDSTLTGNRAVSQNASQGSGIGGGIDGGSVTVIDSTVTNNSADQTPDFTSKVGGGIAVIAAGSRVTVIGSTVYGNDPDGIFAGTDPYGHYLGHGSPSVTVYGSIISGGTVTTTDGLQRVTVLPRSGPVCAGPAVITDGGYNVTSDTSCRFGTSSVVSSEVDLGTNAGTAASLGLAPLAANGSSGPQTMAITTANPASQLVPIRQCRLVDERGEPRPGVAGSSRCDAGAYELQVPAGGTQSTQSVSWTTTNPAPVAAGDTYTPAASASSGLTVAITLQWDSSGCSLSSGVVSFTGPGTCLIDADQAGDTGYYPAAEVQQAITVTTRLQAQTAWFTTTDPSPATVGGTYTPAAAASSGLAAAITLDGASSGCSLSGGVVSFDGAGTCLIDANQAGDAGYSPATQVQQSITVASQTLSLYVAPTGSDNNNTCTSALSPCHTVGRAVTLGETNLGAATAVTVNIAAGTYTENVNVGAVPSGDSLSLIGAGAASTTIDGSLDVEPVIVIPSTSSGAVNIRGLTLTGGTGGIVYSSSGGAGTVDGVGVFGNDYGGGIGDTGAGPLTVRDSILTNNTAYLGGGIYALNSSPSASVTVTGSTISDNSALYGGGIYNLDGSGGLFPCCAGAPVTVVDSTLTGNTAYNTDLGGLGMGGGIAAGRATVVDSTLTGNYSIAGGGIAALGTSRVTVTGSTLSGNGPDGIASNGALATVYSSIISGISDACGGQGAVADGGYNVTSDSSCRFGGSSVVSSASGIGLAALAANGSSGPQTMAITTASPASQLVPIRQCSLVDERGEPRPGVAGSSQCDAGAYEWQATAQGPQAALVVTSVDGSYGTVLPLTTSGGSGTGAVTYAAGDGSATGCSVSPSAPYTLSVTAAGTCTVTATKAGGSDYLAVSSAPTTVTFAKASQAITFTSTAPVGAMVGGPNYTLSATGGPSANPVTFSLDSTSTGCALSGAVITFPAAGSCVIDADQAGNTNYSAAAQAQQSFTVAKGAQAITFTSTAPAGAVVGGPSYTVSATGGLSAEPVTFSLDNTSTGCALNGATVTFPAAGSCVIDANQAGNTDYTAAAQAQQSFTVAKGAQAITFTSTAPAGAVVGGPSYTVTATGGLSAEPVTFSLDSTSTGCGLSGATVTFLAAGSCVIDADQAGNADYTAATEAKQSFEIAKGAQAIAFTSTAPAKATYGGSYTVTATGGASASPVTFALDGSSTAGACTLSGSTVSFTGIGTCVIDANQAGDTNYNPAPQAHQSFTIHPATITALVSGTQTYGASPSFTETDDAPAGVSLTGTPACTTVGTNTMIVPTLAAGNYTVLGSTCTGLTPTNSVDYTVSYAGMTDGFVVSPAATSLMYTGQQLVLIGSSLTPSATISSPTSLCVTDQKLTFSLDQDPTTGLTGTYMLGSATTGSTGQATETPITTSGWREGVYTITASFAGTTSCGLSSYSTTLTVASPGDAANGGGWYSVSGSGRVNFGLTVHKVAHTTSTYTGQLLLINNGKWKLKGTLTTYGTTGTGQGIASGAGALYWWNQALKSGLGDWQLAQSPVSFTITFTASATDKNAYPGAFGIQIHYTPVAPQPTSLPNSTPQTLKGGNIKVS